MSIKNFKRIIYLLLVSVILVGVFNLSSKNSQLQAGAIYDKNNIISDEEYTDAFAMSKNEIQKFLEDHGSILATWKDTKNTYDHDDKTILHQATGMSAAEVIYKACIGQISSGDGPSDYVQVRVNPKVVLTVLQKEQSLITLRPDGRLGGTSTVLPQSEVQRRLNWAMGMGCNEGSTDATRDWKYRGFYQQIGYYGVWQLAWNAKRASLGYSNFQVGQTMYFDGVKVTFENGATAALYRYTPHVGEGGGGPEGQGGNYAFWRIYNFWFGWQDAAIERIAGYDRFHTAVAISQKMFAGNIENVILATGWEYADALVGASFAAKKNAPLLLTYKDNIPVSTYNEISRLNPKNIYVLGEEGAVSNTVISKLAPLNKNVERVGGKDRYETNTLINNLIYPDKSSIKMVFIVTGEDFPDALGATGPAYKESSPIVLAQKDSISSASENYLKSLSSLEKIYIVGGEGVISKRVEEDLKKYASTVNRLNRSNRYATCASLAERFYADPKKVIVVSGENFPDVLAAGPLSIKEDIPIILSLETSFPKESADYLKDSTRISSSDIGTIYLIGGSGAVSNVAKMQILGAI